MKSDRTPLPPLVFPSPPNIRTCSGGMAVLAERGFSGRLVWHGIPRHAMGFPDPSSLEFLETPPSEHHLCLTKLLLLSSFPVFFITPLMSCIPSFILIANYVLTLGSWRISHRVSRGKGGREEGRVMRGRGAKYAYPSTSVHTEARCYILSTSNFHSRHSDVRTKLLLTRTGQKMPLSLAPTWFAVPQTESRLALDNQRPGRPTYLPPATPFLALPCLALPYFTSYLAIYYTVYIDTKWRVPKMECGPPPSKEIASHLRAGTFMTASIFRSCRRSAFGYPVPAWNLGHKPAKKIYMHACLQLLHMYVSIAELNR